MSAEGFFDTNILIYAAVGDDPRAGPARALLAQGGVISVQVLNEFANVASRRFGRSWGEIGAALASIRVVCPDIRAVDVATHERALGLAERYRLSFYDAAIAASALLAGCVTLWSEDMQDGQVLDGRLTIRRPWLS